MSMRAGKDDDLPVLTKAVAQQSATPAGVCAEELASLESKLCAASLTLADKMLREACQDVEDIILERVTSKLRGELPGLVSRVLREHFGGQKQP